jgi:molybdopterin converting factor subunit 1
MTCCIHLFARARDLAGTSVVTIDLPEGSTVADLRRRLREQVPALAGLLERSALAVDAEFAGESQPLRPESEIALLPPVSGGTFSPCPQGKGIESEGAGRR